MSRASIVASTLDPAQLTPSPVNPQWIIDGQPEAMAYDLSRSTDGTAVSVHWSCTAGTFHWYFSIDETVHVVEGEVIVRQTGMPDLRLTVGDVALFRAGTWCIWHVPVYVRKLAFCRQAMPRLFGTALRVMNKVLALLTSQRVPRV